MLIMIFFFCLLPWTNLFCYFNFLKNNFDELNIKDIKIFKISKHTRETIRDNMPTCPSVHYFYICTKCVSYYHNTLWLFVTILLSWILLNKYLTSQSSVGLSLPCMLISMGEYFAVFMLPIFSQTIQNSVDFYVLLNYNIFFYLIYYIK